MPVKQKELRICPNDHRYYKSNDCPVCPFCESMKKSPGGLLSLLSAPARRALINNGVTTLGKLAQFSEKEILKCHGMGLASVPVLRKALNAKGLNFKKQ